MAAAKKCDICGELYGFYNVYADGYNSIKLLSIDRHGLCYMMGDIMDLCPDCMQAIEGLMEERRVEGIVERERREMEDE